MSTADDIRRYKELLDEGIISQDDFDAKKKELLSKPIASSAPATQPAAGTKMAGSREGLSNRKIVAIVALAVCAVALVGILVFSFGSPKSASIVGTWENKDDDAPIFVLDFNDDGTGTVNTRVSTSRTDALPMSYEISSDGEITLVFLSKEFHYDRARSREQALDDKTTYYLGRNELVWEQRVYQRE